jgi:hypothetical protein
MKLQIARHPKMPFLIKRVDLIEPRKDEVFVKVNASSGKPSLSGAEPLLRKLLTPLRAT